jgi:hypothetical protein
MPTNDLDNAINIIVYGSINFFMSLGTAFQDSREDHNRRLQSANDLI